MTLEELQLKAFGVGAWNKPTLKQIFPPNGVPQEDSAIFKFWKDNKDVGTPYTKEFGLEDGTTALITVTGRILHWLGGNDVEVL
jgi:hypothetical protein